jgi:membrane protein implicated in regulation of membrane protease activity
MPIHSFLASIVIGSFTLGSSLLWLLIGLALCAIEAIVPTAFTAFMMGVSAFAIAVLAMVIPNAIGVQVVLWLLISVGSIYLTHRLLPRRDRQKTLDRTEAEALTEILPGQTGRVMYEGSSWRAKSAETTAAIQPGQPLYAIGREGTTLIVISQNLLN